MTSLSVLLVPIVLSAVIVFIASSIIHMVLPYHRKDFQRAPDEDALMRSMRSAGLAPGEYTIPYAATPKEMSDPEYVAKATEGPVAIITVGPSGPPSMGKPLALWFGLCLVISIVAGYVTGRALGPGAEYLDVFRFAGTTALAGYVFGTWQSSIWFGRPWSTTLKSSLDGVVYALLTAGMFGAFWPG
jgi:hypothetical protein